MNAVPVDVLGNSLRIDVLTVVRIKPSVIVFGIVDPILSDSSIVSC